MTTLIVRVLSSLAPAIFAAHFVVHSRTWFEDPSARTHLEVVLLGFFSGMLIASLVSLIKLILSRFLVSTRSEVFVAPRPQLINEDDEHRRAGEMLHSQIQCQEDLRREYFLVDTFESEMREEMVG